jgi:hypothetical protein
MIGCDPNRSSHLFAHRTSQKFNRCLLNQLHIVELRTNALPVLLLQACIEYCQLFCRKLCNNQRELAKGDLMFAPDTPYYWLLVGV